MNNQMAKKPDKNNVREDRIAFEAIVDANGPEEQAMGWYYYLDDKMTFPFTATCISEREISPLKKGDEVVVISCRPSRCRDELTQRANFYPSESAQGRRR